MHRLCLIVLFLLASRDAVAQLAPIQSPRGFQELEPGERYQWGRSTCVVEPSPVTLVCDGPAGLKTLALPGVGVSGGRVSMTTGGSESVFSPSAVQSGDDVLIQYAAYDDATSAGYTVLLRTSLPNLPVLWASALMGGSTEALVEPHEAYVSTDIREGGQVVSDAIYAVSLVDGTVTTAVQGAVGHMKGLARQHRWAGEIIGSGRASRAEDAITYAATVFGPPNAPRPTVQLFQPTLYRRGTFPASASSAFGLITEPDGRVDLTERSGSESIQIGGSTCTVRVLLGTLSCAGGLGTWSLNLMNEVRLPGETGYAEVGPTFSDYGFADRAAAGQTYDPNRQAPSQSLPPRTRLKSVQWIARGPSALLAVRLLDPDTGAERAQLIKVSMQSGAASWSAAALPGAARLAADGDAIAYATAEGLVVYGAGNGAIRSLYRVRDLPAGTTYPTTPPASLSYANGRWSVDLGPAGRFQVGGYAAGTTPNWRSDASTSYRLLRSRNLVTVAPPTDGVGFIGTSRGNSDDAVSLGDNAEE